MKSVVLSAWLLVCAGLQAVGGAVADTAFTIDWSQLGFAFAGSTCYVMYEILKVPPINRTGWHRLFLIFIGLTVSLAGSDYLSEKTGLPAELVATALGGLGYKVFTIGQKRAEKPGDLLNDMTKTDNKP